MCKIVLETIAFSKNFPTEIQLRVLKIILSSWDSRNKSSTKRVTNMENYLRIMLFFFFNTSVACLISVHVRAKGFREQPFASRPVLIRTLCRA